jgi:hypothetical protein
MSSTPAPKTETFDLAPQSSARDPLSTLAEADHLRHAAGVLATSQSVDSDEAPSSRDSQVSSRLDRRVGRLEGALALILQSQARQLELQSSAQAEQKRNTSITSRGVRWAQLGAAAAVVVGPVVVAVGSEWLRSHQAEAGGGILFLVVSALVALFRNRSPPAFASSGDAPAGAQSRP